MKDILYKITKSQKVTLDVAENSRFIIVPELTSELCEVTFELNFTTEGVEAELLSLYKLNSSQSLQLSTITNHLVPHTACLTEVRGLLGDISVSKYFGKIKIYPKAQGTNSYLSHKVLVTGDATSNVSEPTLEIDANDVKASHGSTTGRISKEQLYYLQSRGLPENEAVELISTGFMEASINKITDEKVRAVVFSAIMEK
jgi:Fe-S cluster assembly protein SufD